MPLHSPLPKGWADHLSRPPDLTLRLNPNSPHIWDQINPTWGVNNQGNLLLAFTPTPQLQQGPSRVLYEFSCRASYQFLLTEADKGLG